MRNKDKQYKEIEINCFFNRFLLLTKEIYPKVYDEYNLFFNIFNNLLLKGNVNIVKKINYLFEFEFLIVNHK